MFPGCELLYRTVVFWFSSACIPCSPVWPLWPPSVRDVPWIRCRTEMGGWKRMAAETRQVVQSAQRASINPLHAVRGESAAGCGRHGCVNMPRWNKDHQTHTHTHTCSLLQLGAAVLYVACSGLLRNAEQNHKWTRHTARRHKSQLAGSCSLCFCASLRPPFLSLSCFLSSVNTCPLQISLNLHFEVNFLL